jgi:uncharacterized protein YcbK (DUF882 family)
VYELFLGGVGQVLSEFRQDLAGRVRRAALAAVVAASAIAGWTSAAAAEADRSLKLFFTHTGERATITYKRDGRFDPKGLSQINRFLRDWRNNETAKMDPRLLDLVWEVYGRSGAKDYIHIVSAYRSPATNKMLRGRSRSSGVAKNSQHTLGKAMDFYIPGVKLATLRALAMQAQVGGVGYYPTSGSPFVHLDVGNVRAWPRMSRQELAKVFPNGKTMHLPSNGKPLPGYEQAVADYKRRVGPRSIQIASTAGGRSKASSSPGGVLTALLPTPKRRAMEALDQQTSSQAESPDTTAFVDLASLTVPVPSLRPAEDVASGPAETAALEPTTSLAGLTESEDRPPMVFKMPAALVPDRPILGARQRPSRIFGNLDVVVAWAVAPPSNSAPSYARLFQVRVPAPPAGGTSSLVAEAEFDAARF